MNYFVLIALITLQSGEAVEKEITKVSTGTLCEDIRREPLDFMPQIYLKPLEGEINRVYTCREVK